MTYNIDIDEAVLTRYSEVKSLIKRLTEEAKELEGAVLENLQKNELKSLKTDIGTFSTTARKKWTYPQEVKDAEDEYKTVKKHAEETGTATYEETVSITFRENNTDKKKEE